MSRETQPLPVEPQPQVNSTARFPVDISEKQLEAIDQKLRALFPPLPFEATEEEEEARRQAIEERNNLPGRELVFFNGYDADGKRIWKKRWISFEDFPATRKELKELQRNATGSDGRKTAKLATGSLESKKPPKSKPKPASVPGCYWTADWKLRRSARDEAGNNPFIGQLSQGKYKELKAEAKAAQKPVADILKKWAKEKAAEKGIQL